jgi:predicted HTH transcriptional regulator
MPKLSEDKVRELIRQGESENVEFKTSLRDVSSFATNISALANTHGGILLVGVKEPNIIAGVDPQQINQLVEKSNRLLNPPLNLDVQTIVIDDKSVVAVSVPEAQHVVFSNGMALKRVGEHVRPLAAKEIAQKTGPSITTVEITRLADAIAKQTQTIEDLRHELREANSLKSKLKDYIVGGIIGAVLGVIVTALMS